MMLGDKAFETKTITRQLIAEIIKKRKLDSYDFMALLSDDASFHLEAMAKRVNQEHEMHFGKVVTLYTPMYISNYCVNQCVYCSYNAKNKIKRHKLSLSEIEVEARAIADTGLKHILLLTGESEKDTPFEYIEDAVKILKKYFHSITIEIYPLSEEQYYILTKLGVDGLTIYQETYDRDLYKKIHPFGPKSDYDYRLQAPERGAKAGLYHINIGALLGLKSWQEDGYYLGEHLKYLESNYPCTNFSVSIPRIRPFKGQTYHSEVITDSNLVQLMLALKLYAPKIGLNVSTREAATFREHLLPLGVTKMSAGVHTSVGTHTEEKGEAQFEIADTRSVREIMSMLERKGYQAVMKDWVSI